MHRFVRSSYQLAFDFSDFKGPSTSDNYFWGRDTLLHGLPIRDCQDCRFALPAFSRRVRILFWWT